MRAVNLPISCSCIDRFLGRQRVGVRLAPWPLHYDVAHWCREAANLSPLHDAEKTQWVESLTVHNVAVAQNASLMEVRQFVAQRAPLARTTFLFPVPHCRSASAISRPAAPLYPPRPSFNSPSSTLFMAHSTHRLRKTCPPRTKIASIRQSRAFVSLPRKDTQDKDSACVGCNEYAKGRSDDRVSGQTDVTFNPKNTDLEAQREAAAKEGRGRSGVCVLGACGSGAIKADAIPEPLGNSPQTQRSGDNSLRRWMERKLCLVICRRSD
jgi:hypothetical protein